MDERDREKFYSQPDPVAGDDGEYELEPLDPTIVAAEQRHAKEVAEQVKVSIDIDDIYRDADRSRGTEIVENWVRNFKYQFHIKHVVFATAVLAFAIAVAQLGYLIPGLAILVVGSIAGLYFYLSWQDSRQQAEAEQKRQELYAKRREQMLAKTGKSLPSAEPPRPIEASPPVTAPANPATDMWDEPPPAEPFRFQFSMRSLVIAMTVAAVTFGMIRVLGGPDHTATILGLIALVGLLIHAVGFEPPQSVTFGWWFILALYVLLTLAGVVWRVG